MKKNYNHFLEIWFEKPANQKPRLRQNVSNLNNKHSLAVIQKINPNKIARFWAV